MVGDDDGEGSSVRVAVEADGILGDTIEGATVRVGCEDCVLTGAFVSVLSEMAGDVG
jgi:hypothetical protein